MLDIHILSPVVKALPQSQPIPCQHRVEGLRNEVISFQVAYRLKNREKWSNPYLRLEVDSPAKDHLQVRRVKHVPVRTPAYPSADDNYLNAKQPGIYPDVLEHIPPHGIRAFPHCWETLWFDFKPEGKLPGGDYPFTLRLYDEKRNVLAGEVSLSIHLIDDLLPKQTLIHTRWLHTDCLADWYCVPVFSEAYWQIVENYVQCMVDHGINMVLMPTHTPPLDTRIGAYRPAVQLVDVTLHEGTYAFRFEKLHRWVEMCKRCGVEYYEIPHLFTQWGAGFAPQINAETEAGIKRIFGWDTAATGESYAAFLRAYLPALQAELEALGIADCTVFHISDEPSQEHLENYLAAKELARGILPNAWFIDALSNVAFYDAGAVEHPVPGTTDIEPFLQRDIPDLWTYYCCAQGRDVSNVFVAMPGARTRILGTQLYKFNIKGFLQWGFNFYYSQFSDYLIDPWLDTDCDGFIQSGDAYQVYPGRDGKPVASIRLMLVQQALQDLRAMQRLEQLTDRQTVLDLIDAGIEPIRFDRYPQEESYILDLRNRINREIEKHL